MNDNVTLFSLTIHQYEYSDFFHLDITENVPHLGAGQAAGRKVALQTSGPRKMTETAVEESGLEAGTVAGPGPETGREPGECLQTDGIFVCRSTTWKWLHLCF